MRYFVYEFQMIKYHNRNFQSTFAMSNSMFLIHAIQSGKKSDSVQESHPTIHNTYDISITIAFPELIIHQTIWITKFSKQ